MAQAIAETTFDILYLCFALIAGWIMLKKGKNALSKKAGIMTLLLGAGDAFHLIPRAYSLWTTGLEANAAALGIGKFITSITMTIFYVILYYIWQDYYHTKQQKSLTVSIWILAFLRIALCLLPQNEWLSYRQPLTFGILRNIPFTIMGILILILFVQQVYKTNDRIFRFMPLAIALSFGFYLPVVLLSSSIPILGMLMIPKTLAYVWIICMMLQLHKQSPEQPGKDNVEMEKLLPYVSPKLLLLIAGLVWICAGASVFHIGILDFIPTWHHHYSYLFTAILIFLLFVGLIFYRLVQKHHKRISQMTAEKVPFYLFFDVKSYVIMVFMIVGGKLIRSMHLLSPAVIGILYCGIGAALLTAGIMFLQKFVHFNQSATPN